MKKILLVEDDEFLIKMYKLKFEKAGYQVLTEADGQNACQVCLAEKVDLVVLDMVMPNKDGFAVLSELREKEETSRIPVMALTNLIQDEDVERAKSLGAKLYLKKSDSTLDQVLEQVDLLLKK